MSIRINKFVAQATGMSRRRADQLIERGDVFIDGGTAKLGDYVSEENKVTLNKKPLVLTSFTTIMLNKPVGYVCSRQGQGNHTVYELLPDKYMDLKPVGRLDKDSSGLLLLTNDGNLALTLTHPRYIKEKVYRVELDKPLMPGDLRHINTKGVKLEEGVSRFKITAENKSWLVNMHEGRNRQIRRTFEALGYKVVGLHRLQIGQYKLGNLASGSFREVGTDVS